LIVADTNLISHLLIPGDHSDEARAVLRRDSDWVVPSLWRSEFRNVLAVYLQREQMTRAQATAYMRMAEELLAGRERDVPSEGVLALAHRSKRSAYDCEFVQLAIDLQLQLVTEDQAVLGSFPDVAVSMDSFLNQ
jgi:predicted nucleic acid-binding protein